MRKAFFIKLVVIVLLLSVIGLAYATTLATVVKMGAGSWSGTTRLAPMLFKAGNVAKWIATGITPTGLAITAGAILLDWSVNNVDKLQKFGAWLAGNNYRVSGGSYQSNNMSWGYTAGSNEATNQESWVSWATSAFAGWGSLNFEIYPTVATYNARKAVLSGAGYNQRSGLPSYTYIGVDCYEKGTVPNETLYFLSHPATDNQHVGSTDNWQNVPASTVLTKFNTDINNGVSTAQNAYSEFEEAMKRALEGTITPYLSNILSATNSSGQTLKSLLDTQARSAVIDQVTALEAANDAVSSGDDLDEIMKDTQEKEGETIDDIEDIQDTGIDSEENDTVLSDIGTSEEKAYTKTILDKLKTAINALRDAVLGKVNAIISGGSGSCKVDVVLWEKTVELSFCDIDLTALRAIIISIGALCAVLIILW